MCVPVYMCGWGWAGSECITLWQEMLSEQVLGPVWNTKDAVLRNLAVVLQAILSEKACGQSCVLENSLGEVWRMHLGIAVREEGRRKYAI